MIIMREDLPDGITIEQIQNDKGDIYYRTCSAGGAICRYCEDYWQATIYVEHFRAGSG